MINAVLSPAELKEFCIKAMKKAGMKSEDAHIAADILVSSDARGVRTHGTVCLRGYIKQILDGGMNPRAEFEVIKEGQSWAIADGHNGMGVVNSYKAMKLAMVKAKENVVGMVGVRRSNHFAAAGPFAEMCLEEDMIGLAVSNVDPVMSVPGSSERVIGNNPLAYAIPAGEEKPLVFDIAMSAAAGMKIHLAAKEGKSIPEGWLLDAQGNPTTDPTEFDKGGSYVPMAGHKGYGLALLVEVFAGVITGAGVAGEIRSWARDTKNPCNEGHFFMAIDIGTIIPINEFKVRMDGLIRQIKGSRRAKGVDRIYLPGDIEREQEEKSRSNGVVLSESTLNSLIGLAEDLGMEDDRFCRE